MVQIKYQRPKLYDKQERAFFNTCRYSIVEASTKSGKTHGCIVWILEKAILAPANTNFWWVAPVSDQADIAFRRVKIALAPFKDLYTTNETRRTIELANGATIWFKSGDRPDSLYGEDVYAAVIDEMSRCKEEVFVAVRSTVTKTRGQIRMIGNVKGKKNWAYRLARQAEAGRENWYYDRITVLDAIDAGIYPDEERDDAQRVLSKEAYRELYMAEALDDGSNPFGLDAIARCIRPMSVKPPKYWGWDLARTMDWSAGVGLDEDGTVCAVERWQAPWELTINRVIVATNGARALVDKTGSGDSVFERLVKEGGWHFEGFTFTDKSKQELIQDLIVAIQREEVRFPDGPIREELDAYTFTYIIRDGAYRGIRYEAAQGTHDDLVIALALAWRQKRVCEPSEIQLLSSW